MWRFMTTLGFWMFGVFAIFSGIFCLAMILIVPVFSLQNEAWNRPSNPVTFVNGLLALAIGSIAIYAARGSDRRRMVIVALAVVASVLDELYDLRVLGE